MRLFLSIVLAAALIAVPSRAQQTKDVRKTVSTGNLLEGFNTAQTHNFLNGAQVTFAAGSIVTISGTLNGVPTGGTLDLTNVTVLGLPGGGDAVTAGTLDQFANVTQTAGMSLAITGNTTLGGGSHSGTNTGDQNIVLSGDVTGSGSGSITTTLSNSGVTAGSYGNSTTVPAVTVNAKGQVTSVSNVTITGGSGNVIKGTPFADGQLLYISNATTGEVTGIAGATFTPGNNTIGFNGTISSTGFAPTAITGATGPLQVWIGNSVTGNFTKGNLVEGNGITLTKGASDITVAAVATGTNTGDQNTFTTIKASGQSDITAGSTTANFTVAGAGGITIETTPGTNTLTVNGTGVGGSASFATGMTMFVPDADSPPSGWSLTGVNGIPTFTTPDADFKAVTKLGGTVAAVTANVAVGEVLTGTQVLFETATPSAAIRYTTSGTDPTRTSGTVVSGPVTISADTTYETIAYRDYWADTAVQSWAYTVNPVPTHSGAWTIAADGDTHTLVFSEAISFGAGGSGGFVANMSGGAVTLTYSSGTGTSSIVFTGSRTVSSSETETGNNGQYTQPGNGAEDSVGQDVATFTGHTITNDSAVGGGASYLIDEGFEGAGAPSGWAAGESGRDYDYSASPLAGSESLRLTGPSKYTFVSSLSNASLWGTFQFRTGALGGYNQFVGLADSGVVERLKIYVSPDGGLFIDAGGTTAETTDSLSANTTYDVKWEFDGTSMSVEFKTSGSWLGSGNKFASITGTGATIVHLFLYCSESTTNDFDSVKVDDVDIP